MDMLKTAIFLLSCIYLSESANILYVIPMPSKSHYITLKPIGLELARRGHNVTVITTNIETEYPSNYRQVIIDRIEIWEMLGGKRPNVWDMAKYSAEEFHKNVLWNSGLVYTEGAFNSTAVKKFLEEDNKFDLVIAEQFFQEALNLLAYKYNAPLILVTTYGNCMRHNIATKNPLQLATSVSELLNLKEPDSFWGRLRNLYFTAYELFWWKFYYLQHHEKIAKKYLKNLPEPVPSLYEVEQNAAMILINGHFSFDPPTAYLPHVVEIGGVHISKTYNKLPDDLQKILDESKQGVVYVNFGSNVRSTELPAEKKNAFLKVFSGLKQTVIWKWEDDQLDNIPKNLVVRKWLPQVEILAHPNVKVFVSHGGLLGTQEAVYNGVPIIGVPIYGDQYNNLLITEQHGVGKILEYDDINEETLQNVFNEVINNDMYRKNAKSMSIRFKDRPMTPLDTAVYWIEYVARHKGADFMKNPALNLSWIAYSMLDVYAFILFSILASVYCAYKLISFLRILKISKRKLD